MLGTVLGDRYKIVTVLGAGGFGQTYLAEDMHQPDSLRCVVKQFKPTTQDVKTLEIARRLFHKEVEMQKILGQHDQIPKFLDFFEENQEFYLVQEFVDGEPLSHEFARRRLNEAETIDFLRDVLVVLEFVHRHRVIHRDIKPGNLIRRHQDGKIVLIDFGAVKEIHTQVVGDTGQTSFTVGIGTHGYTPTEQLAGKPRFCSDLYALGMTAIHGLTGLPPSRLPEDPDTAEYLWKNHIRIGTGLAFILDRMIRFHFSQRYQSATEVLQALQRLSELPTDITEIPPSLLLPDSLRDQTDVDLLDTNFPKRLKSGIRVVSVATAIVTGLVLGAQQVRWLEPLELGVFDRLVQLRAEPAPDPRLLIVEITEEDLQTLNRPTPSDRDVATVMANLAEHNPRVVGVSLYRELPQEPGRAELLQQFESPNTVAILNLGSANSTQIPPPPGVPLERVGFNDFVIDPDGTVRRNLMFASLNSESYYSFSLQLALQYLAAQGIKPKPNPDNPQLLQIRDVTFPPLQPTSGAYQGADTAGYQILMDYRSAENVAPQVSFTDVLKGNIDPALVEDKIVLIGTTAASSKDLFNTPYTTGQQDDYKMPGVVVHAQMVSQLLSEVLDGRSLFWFWADWVEGVWIAGWAIAGGAVAWFIRHPFVLAVAGVSVIGVLSGASLLIFMQQGWVPVVAPAIAAVLAGGGVVIYRAYYLQRQQQVLTQLWFRDNSLDNLDRRR
jgi:CHASE2 domain-containing sensor protein